MKNSCRLCSPKRLTERHDVESAQPIIRVTGLLLVLTAVVGAGGCSTLGAKPWDHDLLAEQSMQVDSHPLQTTIDDHIYFSKEASSGGRSFAGGGCGCN